MPHLNKLDKKFSSKGLTVIGVTGESEEIVQRFNYHYKSMNYKIFTQTRREGRYPHRGIPHAYLVSPDGTCIWQGHPSTLSDKKIKSFLKQRSRSFWQQFKGAPRSAISKLSSGRLGYAYKSASKAATEEKQQQKKEAAKAMVDFLEQAYRQDAKAAEFLLTSGEYFAAYNAYRNLQKVWRGSSFLDEIKDNLKKFKKGDLKKEHYADKKLNKYLSSVLRGRKSKKAMALKAKKLRYFAKRYLKDTKAVDKAQTIADRFENPWR